MTNEDYRYFSCVEGHVVARFGSGQLYIGVQRDPAHGWVWDPDAVVAIPTTQMIRYHREYSRALREGALIERTREEYDAEQERRHGPPPKHERPEAPPSNGTAQTRRAAKQKKEKDKKDQPREAAELEAKHEEQAARREDAAADEEE